MVLTQYRSYEDGWGLAWGRAFTAETAAAPLVELVLPGCDAVVDLGSTGDQRLALCATGEDLSLHRRVRGIEGPWQRDPVPLEWPGTAFPSAPRLAASETHSAVISSSTLVWKAVEASGWQTITFTEPNELGRGLPPSAAAITSDALWLGYDHGEWSGSLHRAAVGAGGSLEAPELLVERLNVVGIALAQGGGVWVAGGLAHLSIAEAVLLRIRGSTIESVIAQRNFGPGGREKSLPSPSHHLPSDSFIGAFAMSPDDYPLVAVPNHGIYSFVDGSLRRVLRGKLEGYLPKDGVHHQWGLREFLALPGNRFVSTLTSGELIEIRLGGELRRIELPSADPAPDG